MLVIHLFPVSDPARQNDCRGARISVCRCLVAESVCGEKVLFAQGIVLRQALNWCAIDCMERGLRYLASYRADAVLACQQSTPIKCDVERSEEREGKAFELVFVAD